jgi:hypothetical protein
MLIQILTGQINREISHEHVTALREVMLEEKSIYLIFEYAEHDFLVRANFGYPELILKLTQYYIFLANHTSSFFDSNFNSNPRFEIAPVAITEWCRLSAR